MNDEPSKEDIDLCKTLFKELHSSKSIKSDSDFLGPQTMRMIHRILAEYPDTESVIKVISAMDTELRKVREKFSIPEYAVAVAYHLKETFSFLLAALIVVEKNDQTGPDKKEA
jgi:hypothetical protein